MSPGSWWSGPRPRPAFCAELHKADTFAETFEELQGAHFDLVLVNRVLNADGSSGLELIRSLKQDANFSEVPVMLVSNFEDAQQAAESLGALPGFGKADLHTARSIERIEQALGTRNEAMASQG